MKTSEQIGTHYTSSVFIVNDNRILLLWHKKRNSWLSPGEHVEPNELPHETALREIKEETGLEIELCNKDKEHKEIEQFLTKKDSLHPKAFSTLILCQNA